MFFGDITLRKMNFTNVNSPSCLRVTRRAVCTALCAAIRKQIVMQLMGIDDVSRK